MSSVVARCTAACLLAGWQILAAATGLQVQLQDGAGRPLADVVVYAEPEVALAAPRNPATAQIEQKGLKFIPLVSVIQTGTTILFPNNDKVRHHIYSFSPAHKFDQKLYSGQAAAPQVFERAGTVVLGCNIHDKMLAYVRVVDTPYFAKSDSQGMAQLELPAGARYTLRAWHYNAQGGATLEQPVLLKAGEVAASASFRIPLKVLSADDSAMH